MVWEMNIERINRQGKITGVRMAQASRDDDEGTKQPFPFFRFGKGHKKVALCWTLKRKIRFCLEK